MTLRLLPDEDAVVVVSTFVVVLVTTKRVGIAETAEAVLSKAVVVSELLGLLRMVTVRIHD